MKVFEVCLQELIVEFFVRFMNNDNSVKFSITLED